MSNVNADIGRMQELVKALRNAAASAGSTRDYLSRGLRQIGEEWKDKKFDELEGVIDECGSALSKVERSLAQGERYVSRLVKALIEYEQVNLGSHGVDRGGSSSGSTAAPGSDDKPKVLEKSPAEKLSDFKAGLSAIDERISNYADTLAENGFPRGALMDAVLNSRRIQEQAELLRDMNGDMSHPLPPFDSAAVNDLVQRFNSSRGGNYVAPVSTPRSLSETQYGFRKFKVNGQVMKLYDDPVGTNRQLIQRQARSHFDMRGTCGLCQCANLLTMAGVQGMNEDNIISTAMHSSDGTVEGMSLFDDNPSRRGGTSAASRQDILARCGLSTYNLPVSSDRRETMNSLSEAVRTGHGVIVSVDVARLWRNGQSGGHAISLISVSEDGRHFVYNDTGSGTMRIISSDDLSRALTGNPANITTNIIR